MKPLPHVVCRNSLTPEPTRRPRSIEPLCFLPRIILTVGSSRNLERSHTLSLYKYKSQTYCKIFPPTRFFWSFVEGDEHYFLFHLIIIKSNSIMPIVSSLLGFRHSALSRPSISIISLLMQIMSHEYILLMTFVTSHFVFRHP